MYSIIQSPNEVLRKPTQPVDVTLPELPKIIEEMVLTLRLQKNPQGVGLAANQVGLPHSLFVARFSASSKEPIHVFINPEIIDHSREFQKITKKSSLEGCLSLPKYYGPVKRYKWVKLKYQSIEEGFENCKLKIENFSGFPAVVIQHEMDHLNGKIFVEKILEQKGKLYKITNKPARWEEIEL
ncbi:MAG: peptide deformylase [Patescibacteria group bacterium]